jgi:hypothetical protein
MCGLIFTGKCYSFKAVTPGGAALARGQGLSSRWDTPMTVSSPRIIKASGSPDFTLIPTADPLRSPTMYSNQNRFFLFHENFTTKFLSTKVWMFEMAWVILFLISGRLSAQEWTWATRAGGQGSEQGTGIAVNTNGDYYAVGAFEGTAVFGPQTLTVTGHRDAFIGHWDAQGNLLWVQKAGGKDEDFGSAVTIDLDGNVIMLGNFRSATATFGGLTVTNQRARDYDSLFVAKYNPQGKGLWVRQVNGASVVDRASIDHDAQGNLYLVGCMARFADFGETNLTGYEDILVAKYDTTGQLLWAKSAGSSGYDYGQALAASPNGFTYVTGYFEKDAKFDQITLQSRGLNDAFLAKYDPEGSLVWATQVGGTRFDQGNALAFDPAGGVLLTGFFTGSATAGTNTLNAKDQDLFFARYDADGHVVWAQTIGDTGAESPGSILVNVTTNGPLFRTNIFLTGHFSTKVGEVSLANSAAQRMFLAKWDVDGRLLWVNQAGGDRSFIACDRHFDPIVYVTGVFLNPSAWNTTFLSSAGNSDVFMARLDSALPKAPPTRPAITEGPKSITAARGSAAEFDVLITGTAPVAYRWRKNGISLADYNRIYGSGTAQLNLNSVQPADAGNYSVVVTNVSGSVTSEVAVLTVGPASPTSGPNWNFVRTVGGVRSESGYGVVGDGAGGVYLTGTFEGTNIIGDTILVAPVNARNISLLHFDDLGLPVWARQAGGTKYDAPTGIAQDPQGNVLITGTYSSASAGFGRFVLTNASPGDDDIFLAKYDKTGNELWAVGFGGTRDDVSRAVATDRDGNTYLTGSFSSSTVTIGTNVVANSGGEVYVAKFDPQGQLVWIRTAGGSGSNSGNAVAVDASANVYLAGTIWGTIEFGQTEFDTHFDYDGFVAKYDRDGNFIWALQLSSLSVVSPRALVVDSAGDLCMTGSFDQTCDLGETTLICHGGQDVFLAKLNASGEFLWATNAGGPGYDNARSLAVDAAKNIYVTGSFEKTATFGEVNLTTSGQRDVFISAFTSDGKVLWAKQAGGPRAGDGNAIAATTAGEILVAGSMGRTVYFDDAVYTTKENSDDTFLAKLGGTYHQAQVTLSLLRPGNTLGIDATAGKTIQIEAAANLRWPTVWQALTNYVQSSSPVILVDPLAGQLTQRFYRALAQP